MSFQDQTLAQARLVKQQNEWLGGLIEYARREPGGKLEIRDTSGAVVATLTTHALPKRPQDMPRHLRPKGKLSKRARDAAKHQKLSLS